MQGTASAAAPAAAVADSGILHPQTQSATRSAPVFERKSHTKVTYMQFHAYMYGSTVVQLYRVRPGYLVNLLLLYLVRERERDQFHEPENAHLGGPAGRVRPAHDH